MSNQRIAYYNGDYLPESEVRIPFRDRGFLLGDGLFDMTRTFGGHIFRIEAHVRRLYESLRAMRIEVDLTQAEMIAISNEVLARNAGFLDATSDYWVAQRISRGVNAVGDEGWPEQGPTVIVECIPLPMKARAPYFRDGIDLVVSPVRRTPPDSLTPRAKTANYLNLITANQAVPMATPTTMALLLDMHGNLAEGLGANVFIVKDDRLLTPKAQFVLPGISRACVMELARDAGFEVLEMDLDLHDAYNADEIFVTSTSLCIVPARTFCGALIGIGEVPGPVTRRLTQAYVDLVEFDFVKQFLDHLE